MDKIWRYDEEVGYFVSVDKIFDMWEMVNYIGIGDEVLCVIGGNFNIKFKRMQNRMEFSYPLSQLCRFT